MFQIRAEWRDSSCSFLQTPQHMTLSSTQPAKSSGLLTVHAIHLSVLYRESFNHWGFHTTWSTTRGYTLQDLFTGRVLWRVCGPQSLNVSSILWHHFKIQQSALTSIVVVVKYFPNYAVFSPVNILVCAALRKRERETEGVVLVTQGLS